MKLEKNPSPQSFAHCCAELEGVWLVPDCRMGVGPSEIVGGIIMGMGKFVGGAVGNPELVCWYVSCDAVVMPTGGWILRPVVVEGGAEVCCRGWLGSGGIGDDLTIVTGAGVIVVLLVVCCCNSPAPRLLAGCWKVGLACVVVIGKAVVAAIVMAAKLVSNPVACFLLSGEDGCDGTDSGTCMGNSED